MPLQTALKLCSNQHLRQNMTAVSKDSFDTAAAEMKDGRVAIVTGGADGFGKSFSHALLKKKAKVMFGGDDHFEKSVKIEMNGGIGGHDDWAHISPNIACAFVLPTRPLFVFLYTNPKSRRQ